MIKTSISKSFSKIDFKGKILKGIERMEEDVHRDLQSGTPVDTGRARRGWTRTSEGSENRVPYINALDDGHSKQAPNGIVKPALNKLRQRFNSGRYFK
jgi:hypothetical protein